MFFSCEQGLSLRKKTPLDSLPESNRMDAKLFTWTLVALCALTGSNALAGMARTTNFVVTAPSDEIADKVARCAEFYRKELSMRWFHKELPNWYKPCPIKVKVGQIGAGGSTTFTFDKGEVFGWNMEVQGSLERILDSVIPHEVNHTLFASYFRRPLPRWADEGAATLVEHESERRRQTQLLNQVIRTSRRIPLKELLQMREYPKDMHQVLTLYAEGYSLAEYLVGKKGQGGLDTYLRFLEMAHRQSWEKALKAHYSIDSINQLEKDWTGWVLAGSPSFDLPAGQQLAGVVPSRTVPQRTVAATDDVSPNARSRAAALPIENDDLVIRSQSPDAQSKAKPRKQAPKPLPMIPRKLRVGHSIDPLHPRPGRETSLIEKAEQAQPTSVRIPIRTARGDAEDFRSRGAGQLNSGPSLRPETLAPSANGMSPRRPRLKVTAFDYEAPAPTPKSCYQFPTAR